MFRSYSNVNDTRQQITLSIDSLSNNNKFISFDSGTSETAQILQDQPIEEKEITASDTDNTKNDDDSNNLNPLNTSYFNQIREHSMAIYYGWQLVCLLIFILTAYETLQNV